jgi:hypothetical protein
MSQPTNTVTVQVPLTIRRRGGRKVVLSPDGHQQLSGRPQIDSTLVKALARAFRWQRMLENGEYATVTELAVAEKINAGYLGRILRLTLLPPSTVEAILDGCAGDKMLADLMEQAATDWLASTTLDQLNCRFVGANLLR